MNPLNRVTGVLTMIGIAGILSVANAEASSAAPRPVAYGKPCATSAPLEGPVWARITYIFKGDNGNYCTYTKRQRGHADQTVYVVKLTKNCGSVFQQVC